MMGLGYFAFPVPRGWRVSRLLHLYELGNPEPISAAQAAYAVAGLNAISGVAANDEAFG